MNINAVVLSPLGNAPVPLPCQSRDGKHCGPILTTTSSTGTNVAKRKSGTTNDRVQIRTVRMLFNLQGGCRLKA
jgi:hypothetical protein